MKKVFRIEDLDCAYCAAKVEDGIRKIDGVKEVHLSFMTQKLTMRRTTTCSTRSCAKPSRSRRRSSRTAGSFCKAMSRKQKRALARILVAAALTITFALLPLTGIWRFIVFVVPYLISGYDVLLSAARSILRGQVFNEKFLMSIATIGAFSIGEYAEAAGVMIFYQIGELFQSIAVGKSRKSIAQLMDIRPDYAVVVRNGVETTVDPSEVALGETIVVRPGERIPLDGEITDGKTSVNTSALTGESLPVDKCAGDKVISGSINLSGVIRVRVESVFAESTVQKILELVENASEKKAHVEGFITRFARWYTPCVVVGAVLLAFIPPLFFHGVWVEWVRRALIFLMVSCPCALVVSVPLSFFGGIGGASREGILIKGANDLETLAGIDTVVFDKTGTLTKGSFAVTAIHPTGITEAELLDIAAAAESYSTHPVGESIVAAHKGHIDTSCIASVTEIAGHGLCAVISGRTFYVGNGALMEQAGAAWHECHQTGTIIHIAENDTYLGHIVISDEVKPDAAETIRSLRKLGIKRTVMLTGDAPAVAAKVAEETGVDEFYASLLPADKVSRVESLLANGARLAFVGDGINDAPVLTRADVGVAMGALGSDAAIESADVVLMDDKPSKLPLAIAIARRTVRIVRENITFALAVKIGILVLTAFGLTNVWIAMFGDVGVLVIAILNAIRAMFRVKQ